MTIGISGTGYPFVDNDAVVIQHSNQWVVKGGAVNSKREAGTGGGPDGWGLDAAPPVPAVRRETVIEASPDEVWTAIATEQGRRRWLEEDRLGEIRVEEEAPPARLVWWWAAADGMPTRVELIVSAVAEGTRVVVIESAPRFPIAALASSLSRVCA
jgi:hypothetical protein